MFSVCHVPWIGGTKWIGGPSENVSSQEMMFSQEKLSSQGKQPTERLRFDLELLENECAVEFKGTNLRSPSSQGSSKERKNKWDWGKEEGNNGTYAITLCIPFSIWSYRILIEVHPVLQSAVKNERGSPLPFKTCSIRPSVLSIFTGCLTSSVTTAERTCIIKENYHHGIKFEKYKKV